MRNVQNEIITCGIPRDELDNMHKNLAPIAKES